MAIFNSKLLNYQRVPPIKKWYLVPGHPGHTGGVCPPTTLRCEVFSGPSVLHVSWPKKYHWSPRNQQAKSPGGKKKLNIWGTHEWMVFNGKSY
jgi:hypothetical protein